MFRAQVFIYWHSTLEVAVAILHSRPLVSSTPAAGGMAPGSAACPSTKLRSRNSLAAGSGCGALCSVKFRRYDAKLGSRMPAHAQDAR